MARSAIGFTVSQAKKLFFDRRTVMSATNRAERRVLSKFGAFVMRRAKTSMKAGGKSNKTSPPGQPPRSHGARLLRQFIFFVYEQRRSSVVIGPAKLNTRTGDGDTPEVLEHGGTTRRFFVIRNKEGKVDAQGNVRDTSGRFRGKAVRIVHSRKAKPRRVRYKPRPFMGPAFEAEKPNLPAMWKDSVR